MDLIHGLPDEIARECLNRIPFKSFHSLLFVCKAWNREISSPDFHRARRLAGIARPIFILADTNGRHPQNTIPDDDLLDNRNRPTLIFELAIFDPGSKSGPFNYLPRAPSLPDEFSGFNITGIVGFETNIVVILFVTRPRSNELVNLVYVFDFLTGQWSRGADLPGPGRSVLGLAGDPLRRQVLVAGGYGYGGERLRSAFLYDVATDKWVRLADMERARFECSVVFHSGRFHVISGRSTSQERPFIRMTCAESLDPVTLQWGPIDNEFLEPSASDYHWVMGNGKGDMYRLGQNVTFRRGSVGEWDVVAEVPSELQQHMTCAMMWRDKMVVIGRLRQAYVLDLNNREWTEHELPYDSLYVGCGMDL